MTPFGAACSLHARKEFLGSAGEQPPRATKEASADVTLGSAGTPNPRTSKIGVRLILGAAATTILIVLETRKCSHRNRSEKEGRREEEAKKQTLEEMAEKLAPEKLHSFIHNGQKVFEWDQTLDEVNMYINLPPNVLSKQFYCKIQSKHVEVGIKGNPPYLNHELTSPVKTDSSFWTIEDDIMHLTLQKRDKGQTWSSPIVGQGQLDPYSTDIEQKRLMLQRFQEENPGFDFSQAQFSGACPDPRTFMGGMRTG